MNALRVIAIAALLGCGSSSTPDPKDKPLPPQPVIKDGLRITYSIDLEAVVDKRAAIETAIEVIRRRFQATKVVGNVSASGDNLVVDLAPADAEAIHRTRDLIARTAKLELFVVDNGSPIMKALFTHASQDPGATAAEVKAEVDQWATESGDRHTDFYLTAPDRSEALSPDDARRIGCHPYPDDPGGKIQCKVSGRMVLQRYLDGIARTNPALLLPDDRRLGYEYVEPRSGEVTTRPVWRTYLMHRAAAFSGRSIKDARAALDPNTNRPIVLIDLDAGGAKTFQQLTRENVGKKVAIVLDDRIKSAPIIMSEIPGGRLSITLGGDQPERQQREANELAIALESGALPSPLREESVVELKNGVPQPAPY